MKYKGWIEVASAILVWTAAAVQAQQPVAASKPSAVAPSRAAAASPRPAAPAPAPAPAAVAKPVAFAVPTVPPLAGLLDVQADNLSYDAARRLVIAKGNVKVSRGTDSVAADYAEVDTAAEQVAARGNILIEYQGNVWKGQEATYNFKTGQGDFGAF